MKSVFTPIEVTATILPVENIHESKVTKNGIKAIEISKCNSLEEFVITDIKNKIDTTDLKTNNVIQEQQRVINKINSEQSNKTDEYLEVLKKLQIQMSKMNEYMKKLKEITDKKEFIETTINNNLSS